MARVFIETQPWGIVEVWNGSALVPVVGQSAHIANTDTTAATTWSAQTGGTSTTADQTTQANGAIPRWIDEGEYDLTVGASPPKRVEAISGIGLASTKNIEDWHGVWWSLGNTAGSVGFAGTPTSAPATTITAPVTLPLSNANVPVADTSVLSANGGSFTLGTNVIVYSGRSTASGAGNATGSYSLATATGTIASGTALGFTPIGFGPVAIYQRFGVDVPNRPVPGTTQGAYLLAAYYGPTVDDSAEGLSAFVGMKDTGTPFAQHRPVTGFEAIAQLEGGNTLLDGDTAALIANAGRTMVLATAHAKSVAGFKLSHNSVGSSFGFTDRYYGIWQQATAQKVYTTLNGPVTLPTGTIAVTSGAAMPPATATNPVTVKIGANSDGVGGQLVTYTGISTNNLTGATGGVGTIATGSNVANDSSSLNVRDRITGVAGFEFGDTAYSAAMIAALRGGTDGDQAMIAVTGPTNAEVSGGLTLLRLNAGSGQTKATMKVYDTAGANRFSIGAAGGVTLSGANLNVQQSATTVVTIDNSGYIRPGVTTTAGAAANAPGAKIYSGSGAPALVGVLGDLYFRTDTPGTANQRVYICTTAGVAGSAVWTGIL